MLWCYTVITYLDLSRIRTLTLLTLLALLMWLTFLTLLLLVVQIVMVLALGHLSRRLLIQTLSHD